MKKHAWKIPLWGVVLFVGRGKTLWVDPREVVPPREC